MGFEQYFQEYFNEVKKSSKVGTEYTQRTFLQNLLKAIKPTESINIIQESKKEKEDKGKPDFKIERQGLLIGYIETKPIGTNLNEIINKNSESRETKQLYKYFSVSPNFILTNYLEFILFKEGKENKRFSLFSIDDKELGDTNISDVYELFHLFFLFVPQSIKKPEKLSILLAERTKIFRGFIKELVESTSKNNFKNRLIGEDGLYKLFKDTLIDDLSIDEFIDAYAQTITYGLFLARLNSSELISKDTAFKFIPKSIGALKELFETIKIEDIPENIAWIIDDEIINILNNIDIEQFSKILSFKETYDYEDPYVYFYEKFLADYDKAKRKAKGVYYTPIPIVLFIVNSIDRILKSDFNVDGLSDFNVTALDFATGTGTFLLESFKKTIDEADKGTRKILIKEHLLKHFYGFEYLIAPYTIAHLKLSQFMQDSGYKLNDNERVNVYLTDTLDNAIHKRYALFPQISEEGEEAYKIKLRKPILVITGNPPYNNHSRNNKDWIRKLIESYKEGLGERKINLDDDYIKFLRYAQWKIEQTGNGIIGVITNNSYLDGITHREMRNQLLKTFDKIYILNLHGSSNKGETDKNVFDIKVGVAIVLFIKFKTPLKEKEVYYYSITEDGKLISREEKYDFLLSNDSSKIKWDKLNPKEPYYWFIRKAEISDKYDKNWRLTDILQVYSTGIESAKDDLVIDNEKQILEDRIKEVLNSDDENLIRKKYNLIDTSGWSLDNFKRAKLDASKLININYRPFDIKFVFYDDFGLHRTRYKVMKNFIERDNIGICFSRIWDLKKSWTGTSVSNIVIDKHYIGGESYIAPLYLNDLTDKADIKQLKIGVDNSKDIKNKYNSMYPNANFTSMFEEFISRKYSFIPKPEEILAYIYAILNAPSYRKANYEFLKVDFPKIPFVNSESKFKMLSELGQELINLHLLKVNSDSKSVEFKVDGSRYVEKLKYEVKSERVYINATQYFDGISKKTWEFEVGGYQVLYKWLNERKENTLSYEDISHFKKIAVSLKETLKIMGEIDKIYKE